MTIKEVKGMEFAELIRAAKDVGITFTGQPKETLRVEILATMTEAAPEAVTPPVANDPAPAAPDTEVGEDIEEEAPTQPVPGTEPAVAATPTLTEAQFTEAARQVLMALSATEPQNYPWSDNEVVQGLASKFVSIIDAEQFATLYNTIALEFIPVATAPGEKVAKATVKAPVKKVPKILVLTADQQAIVDNVELSKSEKFVQLFDLDLTKAQIAKATESNYSFVFSTIKKALILRADITKQDAAPVAE